MALNYFSEKELAKQVKFQQVRDRLFGPLGKLLIALRITPNLVSLISFLCLIGVAWHTISAPLIALAFLFVHVFLDAFDGLVARLTHTQSDAGAFVDILNDHYGIVVFTGILIYWNLVDSTVGYMYGHLYTLMIVLVILRNKMGIPAKFVFRSKYFVYIAYAIFAFTNIEYFTILLGFFTVLTIPTIIMSIQKVINHLRTHGA